MATDKATRAKRMREYRKRNPEKMRALDKKLAKAKRERDPAAFIARANERSRRYYERQRSKEKTPEEIERRKAGARVRYQRYKAKHPERIRANGRRAAARSYAANPLKHLGRTHDRRAKIKAGGVSREEWIAIVERFNGRCAYCRRGRRKLEMDHVKPLTKGGLHEPANVVPACRFCNTSKGDGQKPKNLPSF